MFRWIAEKLGAKARPEAEPDVDFRLADVDGAWQGDDGLPRPDWAAVGRAIEALPASTPRRAAWAEAERQWLDELCDALGEPYLWVEAGPVLVLTCREPAEARPFARLAEAALATVDEVLGPPAVPPPGKVPVLAFHPADTYYTYISHYYGDGEHGTSGGVCLTEDDHVHVAVVDVGYEVERTIAHELVHVRLRGRDLPAWVEEGVAEVVARRVARAGPLLLEPAEVRRQQHWWRKRGLGTFWGGTSFGRGDRGQAFSYTLAEVIVQTLVSGHRRQLPGFLAAARRDDAGDAAARAHLGVGIADLAGRFLGEGDWAYDRAAGEASTSGA